MVAIPQKLTCSQVRVAGGTHSWPLVFGFGMGCLLLTGCVPLHQSLKPAGPVGPPCEQVSQVALTWDSKVMYLPNFLNGGQPTPALVGRLYLFGPDVGQPVGADGSLRVEMYDDQATAATGQPKLLGQWDVSNKNLKAGLSRDTIGWGYNLALPLGVCPQTSMPVTVRACYVPKKGVPIYAPDSPINLMPPDRPPLTAAASRPYQPGLPSLPQPQPQPAQPFQAPSPTPLPPGQPNGSLLPPHRQPAAGVPMQASYGQPSAALPQAAAQPGAALPPQPTRSTFPSAPLIPTGAMLAANQPVASVQPAVIHQVPDSIGPSQPLSGIAHPVLPAAGGGSAGGSAGGFQQMTTPTSQLVPAGSTPISGGEVNGGKISSGVQQVIMPGGYPVQLIPVTSQPDAGPPEAVPQQQNMLTQIPQRGQPTGPVLLLPPQ